MVIRRTPTGDQLGDQIQPISDFSCKDYFQGDQLIVIKRARFLLRLTMGTASSRGTVRGPGEENPWGPVWSWNSDYVPILKMWAISLDEDANSKDIGCALEEFGIQAELEDFHETVVPYHEAGYYASSLGPIQKVINGFRDPILVCLDTTGVFSGFNNRLAPYVSSTSVKYNKKYGAMLYPLRQGLKLGNLPGGGTMFRGPPSLEHLSQADGSAVTTTSEVMFSWVMMVCVPESERGILEANLANSRVCFYNVLDVTTESTAGFEAFTGADIVIETTNYVIQGSCSEIYSIVLSHDVPIDIRFRSMMLKLYPHTGPSCKKYLTILSYQSASVKWTLEPVSDPSGEEWMAASMLYSVGYCFTLEKNVVNQVHTRLKAAAASAGCTAPPASKVQEIFATSQYKAGKQDGLTNAMIGWVVAVNDSFQIDPNVTRGNLSSVAEMEKKYGWTLWTTAAYDQLRMTAQDLHATSLRFGYDALTIYPMIQAALTEQMKQDKINLESARTRLANRPYMGCVKILPSWARISTQLSGVVFGLLYYDKGLSEDEKVKFADYAVADICKKVSTPEMNRIKIAVQLAPIPSRAQWAQLLHQLSYLEAAKMIETLKPSDKPEIMRLLRGEQVPGPYIEEIRKKEEALILEQTQQQSDVKIQALVESTMEELDKLSDDADTPELRDSIKGKKRRLRDMMRKYKKDQRDSSRFNIKYDHVDQEFNTKELVEEERAKLSAMCSAIEEIIGDDDSS